MKFLICSQSYAFNDISSIKPLFDIDRNQALKNEIVEEAAKEIIDEVYRASLHDRLRFQLYLKTDIFKKAAKRIDRSLLLLKIEAGVRSDDPCVSYKLHLKHWLKFFSRQVREIMKVLINGTFPEKFHTDLDLIVSLLLLECNVNVHYILHKNHTWYQKYKIKFDPVAEYKFINNLTILNHNSKDVSFRIQKLIENKPKKKLWIHFAKFMLGLKKELIYAEGYLY